MYERLIGNDNLTFERITRALPLPKDPLLSQGYPLPESATGSSRATGDHIPIGS